MTLQLRVSLVAVVVLALAGGRSVSAQAQPSGGRDNPGRPNDPASNALADQLRFHAGPFDVTPYMKIGQIALDTNVFYDQENRRTDFVANGGPGLKIALPIGRVRPYIDGNVDYYWFAKTVQQRHFGGRAGGGFDWVAGGFGLGASRYFGRTYQRPNVEIDQRVLRDTWNDRAYLNLSIGRLRVLPSFTRLDSDVVEDASYLGADLSRSLTTISTTATLELKYGLTPKTDFLLLADQQWDRFPKDKPRDSDSNRFAGGFELKSTTRLAGRAVGGVRLIRPKLQARGDVQKPYVAANISWLMGVKTEVGARFHLDTQFSGFSSASLDLPLYTNQEVSAFLGRRFNRRIDFRALGGITWLNSDNAVVVIRDGVPQTIARDDRFYRAEGDLGFELFKKLRLGLIATYNERQSNYDDFGIEGLLFGARLSFNP